MGLETTSVPRWSTTAPVPDPSGTSFAVVTVGQDAQRVGDIWTQELAARAVPVWTCHVEQYEQTLEAWLRQHLADAVVGWRLMVSGPQAAVARVLALARSAGAVTAELRAHVTDAAVKDTRCIHCGHTTASTVNLGDAVLCAGCGRSLLVYHHFSSNLACFMGFQADAEQDLAAG